MQYVLLLEYVPALQGEHFFFSSAVQLKSAAATHSITTATATNAKSRHLCFIRPAF